MSRYLLNEAVAGQIIDLVKNRAELPVLVGDRGVCRLATAREVTISLDETLPPFASCGQVKQELPVHDDLLRPTTAYLPHFKCL
jgi:hypothetical protein